MANMVQYSNTPVLDIHLTVVARERVLSYLRQHNHHCLRLSVEKTGCSGLSYVLEYLAVPLDDDIVVPLEGEYKVSVAKKSYPYLKGMEIDYVKQGLNTKFVFNNPNQTGQCGCGESFTVGN